jgi:protocatechuate 3,4-dioxygenase beta subunit
MARFSQGVEFMTNPAASRRRFLTSAAALGLGATAFFTVKGAFAEELTRTPSCTEGPFYPPRLPLDTDNDLIVINDSITPAIGEITHLSGRVLTPNGSAVRNATVEIWQCDARQVYLAQGPTGADRNFQGFGRFITGSTGDYYFRTIKPVPYPGRTPHIHVKVKQGGREVLCTQLFINGHPQNRTDGICRGIGDAFMRELVMVDFTPIEGVRTGELQARFDIVLGVTPADAPPEGTKGKKGKKG